jgi:hypothetical protein
MPQRRFPPPWTAELTPNCFIVRDPDGQQLAYVNCESEPGRRSAAKITTTSDLTRSWRISRMEARLAGGFRRSQRLR